MLRWPFWLWLNTLGFWQKSSPPPAVLLGDRPGSELYVASVYHTVAFPWCTDPNSALPKQNTQDTWDPRCLVWFLNEFNSLQNSISDISSHNWPLSTWKPLPGLLQHVESAGEELLAVPVRRTDSSQSLTKMCILLAKLNIGWFVLKNKHNV